MKYFCKFTTVYKNVVYEEGKGSGNSGRHSNKWLLLQKHYAPHDTGNGDERKRLGIVRGYLRADASCY